MAAMNELFNRQGVESLADILATAAPGTVWPNLAVDATTPVADLPLFGSETSTSSGAGPPRSTT